MRTLGHLMCLMKMDTIQVAACQPKIFIKNISHLHHLPSKPYALPIKFNPLSQTSLSLRVKNKPNFQCVPISKSQQPFQVCFAGGSGMMANDNEVIPFNLYICMECYAINAYSILYVWFGFTGDLL